ncbi:Septin-domain-containing protein, partial [Endogone sp. FLAS-F59071]
IDLNGYVGFDTITQQIEKKLLKRGFQFNVNPALANPPSSTPSSRRTSLTARPVPTSPSLRGRLLRFKTPPTVSIPLLFVSCGRGICDMVFPRTHIYHLAPNLPDGVAPPTVIEENGVHLKLNIVDTPGYGDQVNNENCWEPIIKYIKDQHSAYLRKELTAMRDRYIQDTRIHCCLFFISPTGHALKPIDIVVLKKLSEVVNVVPVIAKSDSLTMEERVAFKQRIKEELAFHNIRMYPYESEEDDEQEQALNESIRDLIPFAIVGSERNVVIDGKAVRGRRNRWGVINVRSSPQLPHADPPPGPDRDDCADSLRGLPLQAATGSQRVEPERRHHLSGEPHAQDRIILFVFEHGRGIVPMRAWCGAVLVGDSLWYNTNLVCPLGRSWRAHYSIFIEILKWADAMKCAD